MYNYIYITVLICSLCRYIDSRSCWQKYQESPLTEVALMLAKRRVRDELHDVIHAHKTAIAQHLQRHHTELY